MYTERTIKGAQSCHPVATSAPDSRIQLKSELFRTWLALIPVALKRTTPASFCLSSFDKKGESVQRQMSRVKYSWYLGCQPKIDNSYTNCTGKTSSLADLVNSFSLFKEKKHTWKERKREGLSYCMQTFSVQDSCIFLFNLHKLMLGWAWIH